MKYLKDYKIFEELENSESEISDIEKPDENTDLTAELNGIGKDLKDHGKEMRELVMKIAQEDDEIKDKLFDKTFETFKFNDYSTNPKGNSSIEEFLEGLKHLDEQISKLSNLWDYDRSFKINDDDTWGLDLNDFLSPLDWTNRSLDEIQLTDWVEDIEEKFDTVVPDSFIDYTEPDVTGKTSEYLRMVYISLKELESVTKKCVNIFNRLEEKDSLPMDKYPFGVPMNELSDSIEGWVISATDEISPIIMKKQVNKLFNDINENDDNKLKNYTEFNEGLTLGLALSSGAILQGVGKLLSFAGKKLSKDDQNTLMKVGQTIEKYGHNIHHGIIKLINTILKPLIFWLEPKKQEMVCNVVFMGVLAIKVSSGSFDPSDYKSFTDLVEALLNGIKSTEIASFIKDGAKGLITLAKSLG